VTTLKNNESSKQKENGRACRNEGHYRYYRVSIHRILLRRLSQTQVYDGRNFTFITSSKITLITLGQKEFWRSDYLKFHLALVCLLVRCVEVVRPVGDKCDRGLTVSGDQKQRHQHHQQQAQGVAQRDELASTACLNNLSAHGVKHL
jgi:hypothetical protein